LLHVLALLRVGECECCASLTERFCRSSFSTHAKRGSFQIPALTRRGCQHFFIACHRVGWKGQPPGCSRRICPR
jgi:hypothetical protein